ncbi:MAG: Sec-independent protein translocase protein TatB [Alphaproteobacteria bacterium]|nr:Sec-independent protein translocase protein TatB [Alphaproteobacteria bacterium]
MLDIGWPELLIVALITIIVVGPKELPRVLRTVTQMMRKVRAMASEFQSGIDDLAREAELDDLKKDIEKVATTDIAGELENEIDPTGEVTKSVREIETSLKEDPREQPGADTPEDTSAESSAPAAAATEQAGRRDKTDENDTTPASARKKAGGSA